MFAIRADSAFDGERFVEGGATVFIEGSTIVGVESGSSEVPADCSVTDHGHSTVLPALIDAHVHLVADSGPMALDRVAGYCDDELDAVVTKALREQLAGGVTTVRDLGDRRFNVVDRRDARRSEDNGLPRIIASGPPITSPGGHCHYLGGVVANGADITEPVRERVKRGSGTHDDPSHFSRVRSGPGRVHGTSHRTFEHNVYPAAVRSRQGAMVPCPRVVGPCRPKPGHAILDL